MFDLLTGKPRTTHVRSQSSPYLFPSGSIPATHHALEDNGVLSVPSYDGSILQSSPIRRPALTARPGTNLPKLTTENLPLHCPSDLHLVQNPRETKSSQSSPTKSRRPRLPSIADEESDNKRPSNTSGKIADWFHGESEPMSLSFKSSPAKEYPNPPAMAASDRNSSHSSATSTASKPPMMSRFSLFSSKTSAPKAQTLPANLHDEWYDLDVNRALFPAGPADPFSPAAFKNLVQNAEGLLSRLQTAYKQRTQMLQDLNAEKEAQSEELEGAETRAQHLKLQLDDMTSRLAESDKAMMDLVDEVAREKQARRELEEKLKRKTTTTFPSESTSEAYDHDLEAVEDIADQHLPNSSRRPRTSAISEMSLESEDSSAESIFSYPSGGGVSSPAMSASSISTMNSPETPNYHHQQHDFRPLDQTTPTVPTPLRPSTTLRSSTMLLQNVRGRFLKTQGPSQARCGSCGGKVAEDWGTVEVLKVENKALKERVGGLEMTLEECLDVVKGLGIR